MPALLSARTIAARFDLLAGALESLGLTNQPELEDDDRVKDLVDARLYRLRCVQIAGARHGRLGLAPFRSPNQTTDMIEIGEEIASLERLLDDTIGLVMDLYSDAHSAFYRDGTINPSERDAYTSNSVFTFHFGAYGDTTVSVWAQADHLDDALEIAAEYLAEHAPGLFTEPDYADAARELGVAVPCTPAIVSELYAAGEDELAERICNRAKGELTYTESGYLVSWEWSVSESDTPPGPPGK